MCALFLNRITHVTSRRVHVPGVRSLPLFLNPFWKGCPANTSRGLLRSLYLSEKESVPSLGEVLYGGGGACGAYGAGEAGGARGACGACGACGARGASRACGAHRAREAPGSAGPLGLPGLSALSAQPGRGGGGGGTPP
eukprot:gene14750-biopygen2105